jgi:hypothetical protein
MEFEVAFEPLVGLRRKTIFTLSSLIRIVLVRGCRGVVFDGVCSPSVASFEREKRETVLEVYEQYIITEREKVVQF